MDEDTIKRRKTTNPTEYPSHRSPTRASLSRSHPHLLPAAKSSPAKRTSVAKPKDLLSHVLGSKIAPLKKSKKLVVDPIKNSNNTNESLRASEPRDLESEDKAIGGSEESERNDVPELEFNTPTVEGGRFRDDVDELPETPTHLRERPEYQDTPPRGVLFHSEKNSRRKSGQATQTGKRPSPSAVTTENDGEPPAKRRKSSGLASALEGSEKAAGDNVEDRTESKIVPELSTEEKMRLLKKQEELQQLRKDLHSLKRDALQFEQHALALDSLSTGQDYDKLTNLINLINNTSSNNEQDKSEPALLPVSTLLTSFLPFSIPLPETTFPQEEEEIPSHAPLPDTPELLKMFTPFKITTVISPPSKPSKAQAQITQLHTITLSLSSVFSCTMVLTVSTDPIASTAPMISNLEIPYLSPWAEREIGAWAHARAMEGDAQGLGYGLGRYWELNIIRARIWMKITQAYPHLSPRTVGILSNVEDERQFALPKTQERKKALDQTNLDWEHMSKYLGRNILVCGDGACEIRIHWHLNFDWTSEIESKVFLKAAFPSKVWLDLILHNRKHYARAYTSHLTSCLENMVLQLRQ